MKIAVIRFPGSNCDQDAFHALRDELGIDADYVWHQDSSLSGFEGVFLPGGFTYGDYLRCGAMAARATIMAEVRRFATEGRPVLGACNGFQILCETGLLPGALMRNEQQSFVCRDVHLRPENRSSAWTANLPAVLRIPIAHGEGRYSCDDETLARVEGEGLVAFRYVGAGGQAEAGANPNGSRDDIAGILNPAGNVLGLMPHPERAASDRLGNTDGRALLEGFTRLLAAV
jgi:phosphoribosylformylglycinamidine synthase